VPSNQPSFTTQLLAIWSRLQLAQRATIMFFAATVLAGLALLVYFMNRVDYQLLYRDLAPEDAQAIAGMLKDDKVDFLVSADGTSIQVAAAKSDVDKLRLEIAGSGLASSGRVGYEIFDKSQFGMTDFTEQVNYKRALEGELSRTISILSEITHARVHLVLPKDSLFEEKKEDAKASVLVRLNRGKELSKASIAGIVNLVSGAVEGLQTFSVSVIDEEGQVLSRLMQSADGMGSELESGVKSRLEKEMVAKVISILEPIVGKGKVHANASIALDFNSSEQTEETYNPNPPAVLSQQRSEERVGNSGTAAGVPGTQSNDGTTPQAAPTTTTERMRQSEFTSYEVSKIVRHTVQPKGTIRRISVAVILDHQTIYSEGDDGTQITAYEPRTQEDLDAYRDVVLAAIGYDEQRGDTVSLENIPFFNETLPQVDQTPLPWYISWRPYLMPAMKYAAFITLFLLVYLILFKPIKKRVYKTIADIPQLMSPGEDRKSLAQGTERALAESAGAALPAAGSAVGTAEGVAAAGEPGSSGVLDSRLEQEFLKEAELVNPGLQKYEALKKRVIEHATNEPEQLSQLIRTWIHEH